MPVPVILHDTEASQDVPVDRRFFRV